MAISAGVMAALLLAQLIAAQERVSFPTQDGGLVYGVYGKGDRGVVLAHGGRFMKESWEKQALAEAGFRSLAFDFRGEGKSRGGTQTLPPDEGRRLDVLAAVRYLRKTGARSVSVVGASMGGGYAAPKPRRPSQMRSIAWCCWPRVPTRRSSE